MDKREEIVNNIFDIELIIIEALVILALFREEILLLIILAMIFVVLFFIHFDKSNKLLFMLSFLIGPFCEFLAVIEGAWHYNDTLFRLPLWLPFAWGFAVVGIYKIMNIINHSVKKLHECH